MPESSSTHLARGEISAALDSGVGEKIAAVFAQVHPADIADCLEHFDPEDRADVLSRLPPELFQEIVEFLPSSDL